MNVKKNLAAILATGVLASGIAVSSNALAGNYDEEEWAAIQSAGITLADAILLAEKEVGGRAVEAEVDEEGDNQFYYEIEVIAPGGVEKEVLIDMTTGEIIKIEDDDRG